MLLRGYVSSEAERAEIRSAAEALAAARGCAVAFETYHDCPTAACAP